MALFSNADSISIIVLLNSNYKILQYNVQLITQAVRSSLKGILFGPVEYIFVHQAVLHHCAVALDVLNIKVSGFLLDWSLGYWTEWDPLHACCIMHH